MNNQEPHNNSDRKYFEPVARATLPKWLTCEGVGCGGAGGGAGRAHHAGVAAAADATDAARAGAAVAAPLPALPGAAGTLPGAVLADVAAHLKEVKGKKSLVDLLKMHI